MQRIPEFLQNTWWKATLNCKPFSGQSHFWVCYPIPALVPSESLERVKVGRSQGQVEQGNSPNRLCPKLRVFSWDSTPFLFLLPCLHTIYASKFYWKIRPPPNPLSGPHNHKNFGKESNIPRDSSTTSLTSPWKCHACCFDKQICSQIYNNNNEVTSSQLVISFLKI